MAARQTAAGRPRVAGGDPAMNLDGTIETKRRRRLQWNARERRQAGFMLEECLVYLAVSSVLLGLAFGAFYRVMENAKGLRRNAADIARALQAGERWREDIHRATGPLRLVGMEGAVEQAFHVPQQTGEVVYFFTGTNVVRRANPDAPWIETLAAVKHSRLVRDPR